MKNETLTLKRRQNNAVAKRLGANVEHDRAAIERALTGSRGIQEHFSRKQQFKSYLEDK